MNEFSYLHETEEGFELLNLTFGSAEHFRKEFERVSSQLAEAFENKDSTELKYGKGSIW